MLQKAPRRPIRTEYDAKGNPTVVHVPLEGTYMDAIVDAEVLPTLPKRPWFAKIQKGDGGYHPAVTVGVKPEAPHVTGHWAKIARIIVKAGPSEKVIYKNKNVRDLRLANLSKKEMQGYKLKPPPEPITVGASNIALIPVSSHMTRMDTRCLAKVNRSDLPLVEGRKWYRVEAVEGVFAVTMVTMPNGMRKEIRMHRLIGEAILRGLCDAKAKEKFMFNLLNGTEILREMNGKEVQFKNQNGLDCRRGNLKLRMRTKPDAKLRGRP